MITYRSKRPYSTEYEGPLRRKRRFQGSYPRASTSSVPRSRGLVPSYYGFTPRAFAKGEWKYLDTALMGNVNNLGSQDLLNGIAPGTGASQRVGMKISIHSLEYRGYETVTAATGDDQVHRICIFIDRQANGVAPALGQQLLLNNTYAPRSLIARHRFKILLDRTFCLNASGESGSMRAQKYYMKFRRPIIVEFNAGTAGDITDIVTNSLFVEHLGTAAPGPTAGSYYFICRIRYTDM